jgi:16S rRNA (cytosine967-C5)-methyltransferase
VRPGPRIQATIDLLEQVDASGDAADRVMAAFFRRRRYAGAKDRAAITALFYEIMRRRAWLEWRLANVGGGHADSRALVLTQLADAAVPDHEIAALFDGSDHAPPPLTLEEQALAQMLRRPPNGTPPPSVAGNYPGWLHPALERRFGSALASEMAALNERAPVDLRVNTTIADRSDVLERLTAEGIVAAPHRFSRIGIRLEGNPRLENDALYKEGAIEIQDEGSQIIAALLGAAPGDTIIDYCAGAGGKTLAIGAAMQDRGVLIASDVDLGRMRELAPRARRAGLTIVSCRPVSELGGSEPGPLADRVLVDAPCSGTGTWRRHPVARWQMTQENLIKYMKLKDELLESGSRYVKPGGRLVFATCSVLREEGADRVEAFLARRSDFAPVGVSSLWRGSLDGDCPASGPFLDLSPASSGTDGFFVAVLERCTA